MSKRICIKVYDDGSKVDIRVKNIQVEGKSIYDLKEENSNFGDKVLNM